MNRRLVFVAALLSCAFLAACHRGDDVNSLHAECSPETCPPPDAAFDGEWDGDVTVDLSQPSLFVYPATLSMRVDGYAVSVTGVCPDGAGAFNAVGSGGDIAWTGVGGDIECVIPESPCPRKTVRFTGAQIAFMGGGYIRMDLATECGAHASATTFVGLRHDDTLPTGG